MSARRQLVVDRTIWLRGGEVDAGGGALLCTDGRRCCIGIYLAACGVPDAILNGLALPEEVAFRSTSAFPEEAAWLLDVDLPTSDSEATRHLVHVNDFPRGSADTIADGQAYDESKDLEDIDVDARVGITEAARERLVALAFAEHGVDVTFVDGATP